MTQYKTIKNAKDYRPEQIQKLTYQTFDDSRVCELDQIFVISIYMEAKITLLTRIN